MTNFNRLVIDTSTALVHTATAGEVIQALDEARVANDFRRPLKVVAISVAISGRNSVASSLTRNRIILSAQNLIQQETDLFEWKLDIAQDAANLPTKETNINQIIGNFKDTLFEIEPFQASQASGANPKGILYLNIESLQVLAVALTTNIRTKIVIYYK